MPGTKFICEELSEDEFDDEQSESEYPSQCATKLSTSGIFHENTMEKLNLLMKYKKSIQLSISIAQSLKIPDLSHYIEILRMIDNQEMKIMRRANLIM